MTSQWTFKGTSASIFKGPSPFNTPNPQTVYNLLITIDNKTNLVIGLGGTITVDGGRRSVSLLDINTFYGNDNLYYPNNNPGDNFTANGLGVAAGNTKMNLHSDGSNNYNTNNNIQNQIITLAPDANQKSSSSPDIDPSDPPSSQWTFKGTSASIFKGPSPFNTPNPQTVYDLLITINNQTNLVIGLGGTITVDGGRRSVSLLGINTFYGNDNLYYPNNNAGNNFTANGLGVAAGNTKMNLHSDGSNNYNTNNNIQNQIITLAPDANQKISSSDPVDPPVDPVDPPVDPVDPPKPVPTPDIKQKNVLMRSTAPYDLSKMNQYYMVGRVGNSYYIFQKPLSADSDLNGVFASTDYQTLNNQQIIVTLNRVEGSKYKIYGELGNTRGSFAANETAGTIALTSSSTPSSVFFNAVNLFDGDGSNLYPGVWYRLLSINQKTLYFNVQNCSSIQEPFCKPAEGTSLAVVDIGFIPINGISPIGSDNHPLYLYKWTNVEGKKGCGKIEGDKTLGLEWFSDWASQNSNAPSNCDTGSYIGPNSNNCNFNSLEACEFGFLYNIGTSNASCSPKVLGQCQIIDNVMMPCVVNLSLEPPTGPLFCDDGESGGDDGTSDTPWEKWVKLFPSDSPEYVPILVFVSIIIVILAILGLIIWGIIVAVKKSKNRKKIPNAEMLNTDELKNNQGMNLGMNPVMNSGMYSGRRPYNYQGNHS